MNEVSQNIIPTEETVTNSNEKKVTKSETTEKVEKKIIDVPKDEYISLEKSDQRPSGLYRVYQKGNKLTIQYDDPKKAQSNDSEGTTSAKQDTTSVKQNKELQNLKNKRDNLKSQIKQAGKNEAKVKALKKKLEAIEKQIKNYSNKKL